MIRVRECDLLDSTNLEAKRMWTGGEWQAAPYAVVATEQSGGMGRDGRTWESPPGGLWMTLAWPCARLELAARGLALVVGLAVRDAIAATSGIQAAIKWPNDLLVRGRKICGILCQADSALAPPAVFVGIGVNVNLRADELGQDLRAPATTLQDELGCPVSIRTLRDAILDELAGRLVRFEAEGLAPVVAEIGTHLAWSGESVIVRNPGTGKDLTGLLAGIDSAGCLILDCGGKALPLVSGEVRLAGGSPDGA